jgi:hypothetical protein
MMEKVLAELRASAADRPDLSDEWSDSTARVYCDAAAFHGLEIKEENVPDIYSYAMEAAEALKPVVTELMWVNPNRHMEVLARVKELEGQLAKVNEELDECERTENYNPSYETLCEAVGREY